MGQLSQRLAHYTSLGLDTSIFIYHLEANPHYLPFTKEILSGVEAGQWSAITSTITIMELTVHPWRLGRGDIARKYEAILANFPKLEILDVDRHVSRRAAQLRARFRIRPADALQVATCLLHPVDVYITNDRQLARLRPVLDVIVLGDFTPAD